MRSQILEDYGDAAQFRVAHRFHTSPGSVFETDLGSGYDVILVSKFLHRFDKQTCIDFLRKLDGCLVEGGRFVTAEFVPNEVSVTPPISSAI